VPGVIVVVIVLGLAAIIVAVAFYSPTARMRRALAAIPETPIRHARDGLARVRGRVELVGDPLEAPLTGRPCTAFHAEVKEWRSSGKSGRWVEIASETVGRDFLLRDATGKALVRFPGSAASVWLVMNQDAHFRSGTWNDPTPRLEAFLARHGQRSTGWVFNKSLRYEEAAFEPGEEVVVAGEARWEPDPDPDLGAGGDGYRDAPRRLVLGAPAQGKLMLSDEPTVLRR
jgi:hypothetical protein